MNTKALRQKILDLAIHGRLVPQDPNDEPASVLLQRIREEKERLIKAGKIKRSKKSAPSSDTAQNENVPFEVPESWEWTTLGEVMQVKSGDAINVRNHQTGQFPIYGGNGISGYCNAYNNDSTSIVIGRVGFYCGSVHKVKEKAWITDNAFMATIIGNGYEEDFLLFLLQYCRLSKYSNSTAQPVISGKTIYPIQVPLPPLEEQRRIVAEIERWFSLIDIIESGKANLQAAVKQAKSKILDLAIHGRLVKQDPADEPAAELLRRINPKAETTTDNAQYGKMPKGWAICHINEISESLLGKTLDKAKDTGESKKYLCALNVQWGRFDLTTLKEFRIEDKDKERYSVKKGDLLVCEGGDVGRCAIWDSNSEMYYQNALHRIRCKNGISVQYLLYSLQHFKLSGIIDDMCKGVTIKHFTQTTMNKLPIPLPPLPEQHRIVAKIEELFAQLDRIEASI